MWVLRRIRELAKQIKELTAKVIVTGVKVYIFEGDVEVEGMVTIGTIPYNSKACTYNITAIVNAGSQYSILKQQGYYNTNVENMCTPTDNSKWLQNMGGFNSNFANVMLDTSENTGVPVNIYGDDVNTTHWKVKIEIFD